VEVQCEKSHLLLLSFDGKENQWATDIDASALKAQPDRSQGRPQESPGSEPSVQTGPPTSRSPGSPHPGQPTVRPELYVSLRGDCHAPRCERHRRRPVTIALRELRASPPSA
jgi:hypothetical protein